MTSPAHFLLAHKREAYHRSLRSQQRPLAKHREEFLKIHLATQFHPQPHFIDVLISLIQSLNQPFNSERHLEILIRLLQHYSQIAVNTVAMYLNFLLDHADKAGDSDVKVGVYYLLIKYVENTEINYQFILKLLKVLEDPCFLEIWPHISSPPDPSTKLVLICTFKKLLARLENLALQQYQILSEVLFQMMDDSPLSYHKFYFSLPYLTKAMTFLASSHTFEKVITCLDLFVNRKIDLKFLLKTDRDVILKLSKYISNEPEEKISCVVRFAGKIIYIAEKNSELQLQTMGWINSLIEELLKRLQSAQDYKLKETLLVVLSGLILYGGNYTNILVEKGMIPLLVFIYVTTESYSLKRQIEGVSYLISQRLTNIGDILGEYQLKEVLPDRVVQMHSDLIEKISDMHEVKNHRKMIDKKQKTMRKNEANEPCPQQQQVTEQRLQSNDELIRKWGKLLAEKHYNRMLKASQ